MKKNGFKINVNKMVLIIFTLLLFNINSVFAQWTLLNTIPNQDIIVLRSHQNAIYATTLSNVIYKSEDLGNTWSSINISNNSIAIQSLEFIDNYIFVGTVSNGIFQSIDGGLTWQNTIGNILPVTGFVKKGNSIYAGTLGNGVYVYNSLNNNWLPFNNSLPLNVAGSVNCIASTNNYLFIASGGNGVFHKYNFNINAWEEGYYYGILSPGLEVSDLENRDDTITVVNGNRVIKTLNAGLSWANDNIDARNGIDRIIYNGNTEQYIITNSLTGGSWIQKRNKNSSIGTSWAIDEEFITNINSYDILEFQGKLFLATDTGLYQKNLTLSIDDPTEVNIDIEIFPNPSSGREIQIRSKKNIKSFSILNSIGQNIHNEIVDKNTFSVENKLPIGTYFLKFSTTEGIIIVKKIIIQ